MNGLMMSSRRKVSQFQRSLQDMQRIVQEVSDRACKRRQSAVLGCSGTPYIVQYLTSLWVWF